MQPFIILSATLTFALWVQDGLNRYNAGSWQTAPMLQGLR